jgi:hypothetical protein
MVTLRSTSYLLFVVALVSIATTASPCLAASGGTPRPFKGCAEGTAVFLSPQEAVIDYVGNATHLGNFTRREHLFINNDGFTFQGDMVFSAANGDELWLDFTGMFISATDAIGGYTFTGGTGRFDDATGEAVFFATTPDFVNVSVAFDGNVSY